MFLSLVEILKFALCFLDLGFGACKGVLDFALCFWFFGFVRGFLGVVKFLID